MNGGRRRLEPLAAAGPPRRNRLSRSLRRSQTGAAVVLESTRNRREPDFKTPTRTKPSSVPVLGPDSPHNDLDLQQDIVWDAASPSPRRSGTRGKKAAAGGAVNISEIVSRIAPKVSSFRLGPVEPGRTRTPANVLIVSAAQLPASSTPPHRARGPRGALPE
ncbi:ewing's tumor-associated antigen 1 [Gambusia affinis]|uniref:ewing's tumor-associated antigen 1 n=1 Tax=Gambusia affinis TaxID=33528 RepID=UPI001CDCE821|nr:ewing's tumor-associated antigen 1 [Gambusia affinis]